MSTEVMQRPQSGWLVAYLAVGALMLAVLASLVSMAMSDNVAFGVAAASSAPEGVVQRLAGVLPVGYAFVAGMLAAVNPCGVAMLPGYLALYLREGQGQRKPGLGRVLAVSGSLTASFLLLFGMIGLLLAVLGGAIARWLPVLSLLIGLLLVLMGARLAAGRSTYLAAPERLAGGLTDTVRRPSLTGYLSYGVLYAVTSLSCTLPIFLGVVGASVAFSSGGFSVVQLLLYGLGMGLVILVATVAVAQLNVTVLQRIRGFGLHLNSVIAAVLLIVGAYIVY